MCRGRRHVPGWGALALYEFPAAVLGVRPSKPGCTEITVKPQMGTMQWARGEAVTPKGMVRIAWKRLSGNRMELQASGPKGVKLKIVGEVSGNKSFGATEAEPEYEEVYCEV